MKLLASDYDRTLNTFGYDLYLNMFFINKFMKKGNIFILNTGRSFKSINLEINRFNINYDYLACCDGNLVLNRKHEIEFVTNLKIAGDQLNNLSKKYLEITVNPIKFHNNILEYEVFSPIKTQEFLSDLKKVADNNNLTVKPFPNVKINGFCIVKGTSYYLCDNQISKSTPVNYVADLEKINSCDIFTIGDHYNDVEMIRDFNGYTLPWGKKCVKDASKGVCLSVASLVKKIIR